MDDGLLDSGPHPDSESGPQSGSEAVAVSGPETVPEDELRARGSNRSQRPTSEAFRAFIARGWAEHEDRLPAPSAVSDFTPDRRRAVAERFAGDRLVIPAGELRVRSNDTDYRFRSHSAFSHLTGLGSDAEPDAVLVLHPEPDGGHRAVLYFRPRAGRDSQEFYADSRYGELWVGARPTLEMVQALTGLECAHIDELADALAKDVDQDGSPAESEDVGEGHAAPESGAGQESRAGQGSPGVRLRVVPGASVPVTELVNRIRARWGAPTRDEAGRSEHDLADAELAEFCSELRLVKDEWEIAELRKAVAASIAGFADIVRALPSACAHPRGERVVETTFELTARREGNGVGYDTIAAAGEHACTLHWIVNDGPVAPGELILIDAGVEVDSLYTADITRTLPVDGRFTPAQRQVYEAVLEAADAAFAVARPGSRFKDLHAAAMVVIATKLHEWGMLPVSVEESLDVTTGGQHRRWMVHGTSHHLGIDVHDCAQARREMYLDAELRPGMVFTIEPGLYFRTDDLLVPPELRGIGVRIEDDVLVTADGCESLTAALPRKSTDVEDWMASLRVADRAE
ncbi:MAG: aminopeptidase P family protein [Actinomycetales bacterium]